MTSRAFSIASYDFTPFDILTGGGITNVRRFHASPVTVTTPLPTKRARPPVTPSTIGEALYWSYANLAMAHAYKRHTEATYQQTDYIVRNKTYHGLLKGTLRIGSFLKDEKSKIAAQACCYCGSDAFLSLDHLIPQFSGGAHSADNLVVACRSCNSSKGKRDFLNWMATRGQFPPLKPLRRYLKLVVHYCVEHNIMAVPLDAVSTITPPIPFSLSLLPYSYPAPLVLRGQPADGQLND